MSKNPLNSGQTGSSSKLNVTIDYRIVSVLLSLIVAILLVLMRPGMATKATDRTIEVTGSSSLTSVPDKFVFYPSYEFKNADKQLALQDLTKKNDEIIAKLKSLGVLDKDIKTNSGGNNYPIFYATGNNETTYNLQLTISVSSQELAQKVQDYLVTTTPMGSVSPQADFSDQKRKTLEATARDQATKEARLKADQSAKNLGFKIGGVKSVSDGAGFGGIVRPMAVSADSASGTIVTSGSASLSVQPGENNLNYTVTVIYYIH